MDKIDKITGCYFASADELKASFIGYNTDAGYYLLEAKGKISQDEIQPFFMAAENFCETPGFKLLASPIPPQPPFTKDYDTKQTFYKWPIPYKTEVPIQTASGINQVPVKLVQPGEYLQNTGAAAVNDAVMKNMSMAIAVPGSTSPGPAKNGTGGIASIMASLFLQPWGLASVPFCSKFYIFWRFCYSIC